MKKYVLRTNGYNMYMVDSGGDVVHCLDDGSAHRGIRVDLRCAETLEALLNGEPDLSAFDIVPRKEWREEMAANDIWTDAAEPHLLVRLEDWLQHVACDAGLAGKAAADSYAA